MAPARTNASGRAEQQGIFGRRLEGFTHGAYAHANYEGWQAGTRTAVEDSPCGWPCTLDVDELSV